VTKPKPRAVAKKESTPERIVDAAVELFNRDGVGAVTTNHIAAHAGISPGNLYYHFANREEIIRVAFGRMNAEAEKLWQLDAKDSALGEASPPMLQRILLGNLDLYARYLFFARELPALVRADPKLAKSYREVHAKRMLQLEGVLALFVGLGLLRDPGGPEKLRELIEGVWMVGMFWLPYAELAGRKPTRAEAARGALFGLEVFRAHLPESVHATLVELLNAEAQKS
jgi:AcrR family transcriptional regulator